MSPRARLASARGAWLPTGRALTERDFVWRHRVVCTLLAAHLPALTAVALVHRVPVGDTLLQLAPVAALLAAAVAPVPRRAAALAATVGLLLCSALLVHAIDGQAGLGHYFVALALVALYQDWTVLAAGLGAVVVQHGVVGALAPGSPFSGGSGSWQQDGAHVLLVLAESAVLVLFWHANEQARAGEDRLARALWEGQSSLRERLQETDRMRRDLIATVSHEFRTPLTGIRGAALTLLKRGERLDRAGRERLLHAVLDQQERLSRLLENMLVASRATAADPQAVADVHAVATEVAMLAGAERRGSPAVSVLVEPGTVARIDRHALHQVLANLVDNAQVHGARGAVPLVTGGRDDRGVWVAVSNDGSSMDPESAARLFEPFAQADSGATRRAQGLGMGLFVVHRLVDAHGGHVDVRSDGGWVTVEVRLTAASDALPEPREEVPVAQGGVPPG